MGIAYTSVIFFFVFAKHIAKSNSQKQWNQVIFQVIVAKNNDEFTLTFRFGKQRNKQSDHFEIGVIVSLTLPVRIVTMTNTWERAMAATKGSFKLLRLLFLEVFVSEKVTLLSWVQMKVKIQSQQFDFY